MTSDVVRLRTGDGRVLTYPRATAAEAWAAVVVACLHGFDVGGEWQAVRVDGPDGAATLLYPASAVVEPLRAVRR